MYSSGQTRFVRKQNEATMKQLNKLEGISKPRRIKHSFTQSIKGTPEQVFPLLCPVRETDWIPGWTTDWVISNSGLAEQNCIFQMKMGRQSHTQKPITCQTSCLPVSISSRSSTPIFVFCHPGKEQPCWDESEKCSILVVLL